MILKYCRYCNEFFESKLLSFYTCCSKPACRRNWEYYASAVRSTRSLTANCFDVWDDRYPLKNHAHPYERVCRVCGKRLLKKDGTYGASMRHCEAHRGQSPVPELASWGLCAATFANNLRESQTDLAPTITKLFGLSLDQINLNHFLFCQKCHTLSRMCDDLPFSFYNHVEEYLPKRELFSKLPMINIHHLRPVHTLSLDDLALIWDHKNLTAVCRKCHGEYHRKQPVSVPVKSFKTMEAWL